ncbi:ABC transporter substrate-binding protein [Actinomadura kijaniata]|uniref:Branched-chain amino acid transport system substrate-binding protein n=1 Tax=Actinomadura namibiensis TaxID=182080 RepID=A0A7W3LJA4_ACTNM|nr:ABC transporter substrate-binding protein [Actinomadura namibiensis]MBA8949216.1 branched-chain amino acid transport system substrate-binding protein [Actinomadura namibiensis]
MGPDGSLCIGAVVPRTGRLSTLGDPLAFVVDRLAPHLRSVGGAGRRRALRFAVRDSRSDPDGARRAVRELVERDRADVVITMAGTRVLPAVADACERRGVPCVSTTFPWQAYVYSRADDIGHRFAWTYHFAWGLDDIATVFADIWERLDGAPTVGCLWNDDLQGRLLRHERHGFVPAAARRGHRLVDPGGYREPATDFGPAIEHLRRTGVDVVTSAATATDLGLFHRQARRAKAAPRLITCSRWLAYPHAGKARGDLADARVATLVYWTPGHPHRSSLDGTTAAELATAYRDATGAPWLQPLGLAHALVEVAHHALAHADDPAQPASVARTIARARVDTIAGTLDWTRGPAPNIALVPLVGGQWRPTRDGHDLAVVTNTAVPQVPVTADVTPT